MKTSHRHIIFAILLIYSGVAGHSQQYFRICGDMTIKSKTSSGEQAITMGRVFFDRNNQQIVYRISFPEEETWVTTDSLTYRIINDSLVSNHLSLGMAEFSVFNLALNSQLADFGLKKSSFHIVNVERKGDLVITSWAPEENMKEHMGNILVSTKNKMLFAVVFMNAEGEVLRKQFFEEYFEISGIAFPAKIVEIGYDEDAENYQVTNFRNIRIDELENNSIYNYSLPDGAIIGTGSHK